MATMSAEQRVLESFLLEVDVRGFHLEGGKLQHSAGATSTRNPKKKKSSWERIKEDLMRLRAEVLALQTFKRGMNTSRTQCPEYQKSWRDAAKREKRRCQRARGENVHLKNKLNQCTQAFRQLTATIDQVRSCPLQAGGKIGCCHQEIAGPSVFSLLERRVNCRLGDLNAIYRESIELMVGTDIDGIQVHRGEDATSTASLEFKRAYLLPFDAAVTASAVWDVVKLGVMSNEQCARIYMSSNYILASQGCFTQELEDGGSVEILSRYLMKRVELPEGSIVLVEGMTEWLARPLLAREWSHVTRDSGWIAVHPVASTGTCQFQNTLRLQPHECEEMMLKSSVSDIMISSFRNILSSRHQLVDNTLIDSQRVHLATERSHNEELRTSP